MLVWRAKRHVAAPRLAARAVDLGAVRNEQLDQIGAAAAANGVRDERAVGRIGAVLEHETDVLEPVLVEGVGERVRAVDACAVLEQDAHAVGPLGLGCVIQRLAVVGVRAGFEQGEGQFRVVPNAGGAVERGHLAVVVDEEAVRVGAERE